MLYYEGLSCPVCQKPFMATDDIVVCPVCGLPHHRSCWMEEGHCHDEVLHGTDQQWSREKAVEAEDIDEDEPIQAQPVNEYTPAFTPNFSQEPASIEYLEEIPLTDFSAMVTSNLRYYLPRFLRIDKDKKTGGWNWAAFIFGWRWLLYRKQFGLGIALFIARLLIVVASLALLSSLGSDVLLDYTTAEEMMSSAEILSNALMENESVAPFVPALSVFTWIYVSSRLYLGMFGNKLYYKSCQKKIRKAKSKIPDLSSGELAAFGGTAIGIALAFHLLLEFLPMFLSTYIFPY